MLKGTDIITYMYFRQVESLTLFNKRIAMSTNSSLYYNRDADVVTLVSKCMT